MLSNQSIYQSINQSISQPIKEKLTQELHLIYNSYQALVSITEAKHKSICPDVFFIFLVCKDVGYKHRKKNVLHVYRLMLMLIE